MDVFPFTHAKIQECTPSPPVDTVAKKQLALQASGAINYFHFNALTVQRFDGAMHIDQLIFIVLIALTGLFKLLAKRSGERRRPDEPRPGPIPSSPANQPRPADTDEERIRRFLEALGQPTSSTPPPPVRPRTAERPRPAVLPHVGPGRSPLPPLTTRPPDLSKTAPPVLPRQVIATKPPPVPRQTVEPPPFEVHADPFSIETSVESYAMPTPTDIDSSATATDLAKLLGSTSALRNAIILREIFGPPRSLQQFEIGT